MQLRALLIPIFILSYIPTALAGIYDFMSEKSYEAFVGQCNELTTDTVDVMRQFAANCRVSNYTLITLAGTIDEVAEKSFFIVAGTKLGRQLVCDEDRAMKLSYFENSEKLISEFATKVPALRELKQRIGSLAGQLQLLKGQVPNNPNGLPLSSKSLVAKKQYDEGQEELKKLTAASEAIQSSLPFGNQSAIRDLVDSITSQDIENPKLLHKKIIVGYTAASNGFRKNHQELRVQMSSANGMNRETKESIIQDHEFVEELLIQNSIDPKQLTDFRCKMEAKYGVGTRLMDTLLLGGSIVATAGAGALTNAGRAIVGASKLGRAQQILTANSSRVLRASAIGLTSVTAYREIDKACLASTPSELVVPMGESQSKCSNEEQEYKSIEEGNCVLALALSGLGLFTAKNLTDTGIAGLMQYLKTSGVNAVITSKHYKNSIAQEFGKLTLSSASIKQATIDTELSLTTMGAKFKRVNGPTALDEAIEYKGIIVVEKNGEKASGQLYEIQALPTAAKASGSQYALLHPEMAAHKAELERLGYKMVVDSTLQLGPVQGYLDPTRKVVGIGPHANWSLFKHEFQHVEFDHFISARIDKYVEMKKEGKSLAELWRGQGRAVERLGMASVRKIEKMLNEGHGSLAINETLAVDAQLKASGWKRYAPMTHGLTKSYAYSFQAKTEGTAGNVARVKDNLMLIGEMAVVAGVGSYVVIAKFNPNNYLNILYRETGELFAQKPDGTWVEFSFQKPVTRRPIQ